MKSFTFEHSYKFSEQEYVDLMRLTAKKKRVSRLAIGLLIGIACLFCLYTIVIGLFLIVFIILTPFLIRRIPGTVANNYKKIYVLRAENLYGVNENDLWMKNTKSFVKVSWKLAQVWDEKIGWLRIASDTNGNFWFPVDELKNAGVYKRVKRLCKINAVRYNSDEASRAIVE